MQFTVCIELRDPESFDLLEAENFTGTLSECVPHVSNGFCRPGFAGVPEPDVWPTDGRDVCWLLWPNYDDLRRDGKIEARSLHFPASLSPASRRRICRLFGLKC